MPCFSLLPFLQIPVRAHFFYKIELLILPTFQITVMNLNGSTVSSTDSTDENLVSTERNSSISISFSDDENEKPRYIACEKPSRALLAKIKTKKIKSPLKASPLKNPTSISDDIASLPSKRGKQNRKSSFDQNTIG